MNKKNLISLIILDIVVMALALGLIIFRYQSLTSNVTDELISSFSAYSQEEEAKQPAEAKAQKHDTSLRNIRFMYRNSKVKLVEIIGDFNGWVPEVMKKEKNHTWIIDLALEPGEYAYNFVVDARPIRDPNNPKICNAGRGFTSSFLNIKEKK
jgi:hypothetical protein